MKAFVWLLRAIVFFTLFAFALNNQGPASVHLFFGQEWHAPMVFIVLAAFGLGCAFGIVAMVPSWWRHRRNARSRTRRAEDRLDAAGAAASAAGAGGAGGPGSAAVAAAVVALHPPRDGL